METKKIALITGVSRAMGLGFEITKQLAELGFKVIMTARDIEAVATLAEQLRLEGFDVLAKQLDITKDESVASLKEDLEKNFGKLDLLINNAGAYFDAGGNILNSDLEFINQALQTNLLGTWRVTKALMPLIRNSREGRIVNVSSGAGSFQDPVFGLLNHPQNVPVYAISKLALNGFTVKLAKELKEENILVCAVCPGWVATYPGTAEWGARPVNEGAKGIVWAATADNVLSGGFYRDGQTLPW